jgi:hypothetical protein
MMAQNHFIGRMVYDKDNPALGQHARNVQGILNQIPVVEQRVVDAIYKEPFILGNLSEEPFSIELVRVVNMSSPLTTMKCGGMIHFTFLPAKGGASIASIDGLSPVTDGTTKLRFFFRISYNTD